MTRVRRNVLKLPAGDKTLVWYGRAIEAMQRRPIAEPTSWRFQAAIHEYERAFDPLAVRGEALLTGRRRKRFWTQCQHGSWFFLPWHRMYLHFFEQIVAAAVASLGGPADWALPYWNYSAGLQSRLLPKPFRGPTLGDGSKNYLFVAERAPDCNAGNQFADDSDVDPQPALTQAMFSDTTPFTFGGPQTDFMHSGMARGVLESVPHGVMHVAIGGDAGWMSGFTTAPLDPIFWLHHANLDRLWEVWLNRDPAHRNPASLRWLSMTAFSFYDASGQIVTLRPR